MREIKFRVWDEEYKHIYGAVSLQVIMDDWFQCGRRAGDILSSDISHLNFELYTGLKDKNGSEIYEGDIVELSAQWGGFQGLVIFEYGCFGVKDGNSVYTFQDIDSESLEIIGNIHENPELLEGE